MRKPSPISIALFLALLVGVVGLFLMLLNSDAPSQEPVATDIATTTPEEISDPFIDSQLIGVSVEGREITATSLGNGETNLLFVGGMHGGYEWNSSLLAYEMIDHLSANHDLVPEDVTIHIIPDLNPDGTAAVLGFAGRFTISDVPNPSERVAAGRFNANDVDLNRNFDCKWAPTSTWRGEEVSAGTGPFSEPEAQALRDYVRTINPAAVVFWHSRANNVYASECENGVLPETLEVMSTYAQAADYGEVPVFDAYPITGDAEGWLASLGIPAVTVELETHNSIEWSRNLAGTNALIEYYSNSLAR